MAETTSHEADSQAPAAVGEVVAVHGPLVEVKFAHHRLPPLRSWLVASAGGRKTILAVAGFLTDGDARAVAVADGAGLKIGQEIAAAGEGIAIPIDDRNAREAVAQIARLTHTTPGSGRRVETGIKALDLFCPLVDSDVVGFAAPPGVGQIVLIQELLYRLATRPERLTLIATVPTVEEPSCEDPYSIGGIQTVYLPRRDMAARPAGFLDPIDVVIALSLDLARLGMYPAIDPLASRSMHLDADTVGSTQIEVATRTRELLRRYPPEQEAAKPGERPADERRDAARARRLRRFLTQPFYVAAPWIRWSAAFVPLADTIRGCQGILDGAYDDLPEEAFYMANSIEEVVSRAGG